MESEKIEVSDGKFPSRKQILTSHAFANESFCQFTFLHIAIVNNLGLRRTRQLIKVWNEIKANLQKGIIIFDREI